MPLAFSNLSLGNAANTAINNYMQPSALSPAALANAQSKGIGSNLSIGGNGQVAVKPPATTAPKTTTAPVNTTASSMGSYKGVAIKPGDDASIQAQIRAIDAQQTGGGTAITSPVAPAAGILASQNQPAQQPQQPQQQTQQPAAPTYGGLVGNLASVGTNGTQAVNDANQKLQQFRQNEAEYQAAINGAPTSARVMQGRQNQVQIANAQIENSLASSVTNALTGQGQQISALGTAAGYAQPQVAGYGQTVFNPLTGTYEGGSAGLDPQSNATTLADAVLSGRMSYDDAASSLGYAGSAGTQFLNNAIMAKNPQANINQLKGQAAATQSNTQLAGTAQTGAAAQGYTQAIQTYQAMNTSYQAADAQAKNVQNVLASTGLNSGNSTDYNTVINKLRGRFSDTNYAQLSTSLAELQNMYTNLLSLSGGTPSGSEAQALAVLNPNSSASAINASIGQLQTAAYNKLNALYGQAQTYQGALQGGGGTGGSTGGGSVSGFGWNG